MNFDHDNFNRLQMRNSFVVSLNNFWSHPGITFWLILRNHRRFINGETGKPWCIVKEGRINQTTVKNCYGLFWHIQEIRIDNCFLSLSVSINRFIWTVLTRVSAFLKRHLPDHLSAVFDIQYSPIYNLVVNYKISLFLWNN